MLEHVLEDRKQEDEQDKLQAIRGGQLAHRVMSVPQLPAHIPEAPDKRLKPKLASVILGGDVPTVLRVEGFAFVIHLNDHAPPNVHVSNADGECRIVLEPDAMLDKVWNMKASDARRTLRLAAVHRAFLLAEWKKIHGQSD